jgi:hypothetical protein
MLKQKKNIPEGINQFCRGGGGPENTMEYQVYNIYAKAWNALELFFTEKNEIIEQLIE